MKIQVLVCSLCTTSVGRFFLSSFFLLLVRVVMSAYERGWYARVQVRGMAGHVA